LSSGILKQSKQAVPIIIKKAFTAKDLQKLVDTEIYVSVISRCQTVEC